ncbi:hypothetical protein DRO32_00665 [Candidatus Bathyarchaeota archaeon]|nr:MAG: hypothetical protein DRO32_00665 [Candidatus Bathyarchaeota archaeon]
MDIRECEELLDDLASRGLVEAGYSLSREGREAIKVVLTGGVFDVLHVGHLATLEEAKRLGDVLVVVVARDETVERLKGRRPLNKEEDRLRLVSALKPVDMALLGDLEDMFKVVELVKPDVIALGYDQKHDEEAIREELSRRGLDADVVRLKIRVPGVKSSMIIARMSGRGAGAQERGENRS